MNTFKDSTDVFIEEKLIRNDLAKYRKQKHLTQKELSDLSGLATSTISAIENSDNTSVTLKSICAYAASLNLKLVVKFIDEEKEESK